ncbi:hypothetical protein P152DRAFT_454910, partial [Eremomyces bilateralis CBS 781.70]
MTLRDLFRAPERSPHRPLLFKTFPKSDEEVEEVEEEVEETDEPVYDPMRGRVPKERIIHDLYRVRERSPYSPSLFSTIARPDEEGEGSVPNPTSRSGLERSTIRVSRLELERSPRRSSPPKDATEPDGKVEAEDPVLPPPSPPPASGNTPRKFHFTPSRPEPERPLHAPSPLGNITMPAEVVAAEVPVPPPPPTGRVVFEKPTARSSYKEPKWTPHGRSPLRNVTRLDEEAEGEEPAPLPPPLSASGKEPHPPTSGETSRQFINTPSLL